MVEINRNEMKLLYNISENDIKIRIREIHESIDLKLFLYSEISISDLIVKSVSW